MVADYTYNYISEASSTDEPQITVSDLSSRVPMTVFGNTIGTVEPTDLFRIDATQSTNKINATLYLVNTPELSEHFSYLIFNITVYVKSSGDIGNGVSEESSKEGDAEVFEPYASDLLVTMHEAALRVTLDGQAIYKVSIDGGSYYCIKGATEEGFPDPLFHLSVS